jgi:hypothetical protein
MTKVSVFSGNISSLQLAKLANLAINKSLISMWKLIVGMVIAAWVALASIQAQQWGAHAGATLYLSEVNGANVPSAGLEAGVSRGPIRLGVYGLRNLQPVRTPDYEANLQEHGLWAAYLYPAAAGLNLAIGIRGGLGTAGMEPVYNQARESLDEADIRAFSPELGIELALGRHISLTLFSGYRWVWGAEKLEYRTCGSYSSLFTGLSARVGFFPGR